MKIIAVKTAILSKNQITMRGKAMKLKCQKAILLLLTAVLAMSLFACDKPESASTDKVDNAGKAVSSQAQDRVKITKTAAQEVKTEVYKTADFSITVPKGWKVTTGGANIYHSIRVSDPDQPLNGMFILLKAECLLHSQAGKAAWQTLYKSGNESAKLFANAPVLKNPSTENFFKIFSKYADFASKLDATYAGFKFPRYNNFKVTQRFKSKSGLSAYSINDKLLRATFTDNGKKGEGMFSANVVDFGSSPISDGTVKNYMLQTVDGGYYMAYNIVAITAAKDTFIEWESVLTDCMKTLKYSDSFVSTTNQASDQKVALANKISQNFNQTMDGIMSSWENRNKSSDIISQKRSDATLGYERVYDTQTNEVYKATNGFGDSYDGTRYQSVTDDNMYTEPISGYIEKID